jgi:hypothetical protein
MPDQREHKILTLIEQDANRPRSDEENEAASLYILGQLSFEKFMAVRCREPSPRGDDAANNFFTRAG